MKPKNSVPESKRPPLLWPLTFLAAVLAVLFWRSFLPGYVHFSNDGPLGAQMAEWLKLPEGFTGMWNGLNLIGFNAGASAPSVTVLLRWILGAVGYSKFYAPVALLMMGMGAWAFFRALKLSQVAAVLGALAMMLSTGFFAGACWGIASAEIALGFNFIALALVLSNHSGTPRLIGFLRLALAGFCVGVNVMEAADVGAMCSVLVAAFVFFKTLFDSAGPLVAKTMNGIGRVIVVTAFAGLIAGSTVVSLLGIGGVVSDSKSEQLPQEHWDWATQWSLPKLETLGIFVPGVFGYRQDTPNKLPASLQDAYRGGVYWGGMGRDPKIDRYFDAGGQTPPPGLMRFGYAGYYCGIFVLLGALWAMAQLFRRQNSTYTTTQKKLVWFWTVVLIASLLLAWGRFAPMFYGLLYKLPYFSTIRNPTKFLIFFQWALAVLFAYGIDALSRRYLDTAARKWDAFDRKLIFGYAGIFGASVLGWIYYSTHKAELIQYIQKVGFPDEETAARIGSVSSNQIAAFSIGQAGWFVFLLAAIVALLALVAGGFFSGPRAKLGVLLLGAFLIFDLGRANLPFIIHWDYKQKYEVGSLNPILETLRNKPYEHRVVGLPFESQQPLRGYDNTFGGSGIYRIEWTQHHFLYYNIQCLDVIQMPRVPEDIKAYLDTFAPRSSGDAPLLAREWQLTNTRYLLGAAGFLDALNFQLDPQQKRFRIAQRFDIVPKPGITRPTQFEDLTAMPTADGDLALFEFTGALPRVKLYANWQVNTNDEANLKTLADLNFDPAKTVLISTPQKDLPALATNENSGTVEYAKYSAKQLIFTANVVSPSVLLLNDHHDPNWRVTVDGKPDELLRCNFIMRGVYLTPGQHTVEFYFSLPNKPLYVTLSAIGVALTLGVWLLVLSRKKTSLAR